MQQATIEFQIPWAYQKKDIFQRSPKSNLQNDLESHQATIEFQIPMAYQPYIISTRTRHYQNDLESQQATD